MNRAALAQECKNLGWPALTEAALSNIETGRRNADGQRRREVSVDEWLVLAAALRIPPATLLLPVADAAKVRLFGDVEAATDRVLEWITIGFPPDGLPEVTTEARETLTRTNMHAQFVAGLLDSLRDAADEPSQLMDEHVAAGRELLTELRQRMRAAGQVPPQLPPELADLDLDPMAADEDPQAAERRVRLGQLHGGR